MKVILTVLVSHTQQEEMFKNVRKLCGVLSLSVTVRHVWDTSSDCIPEMVVCLEPLFFLFTFCTPLLLKDCFPDGRIHDRSTYSNSHRWTVDTSVLEVIHIPLSYTFAVQPLNHLFDFALVCSTVILSDLWQTLMLLSSSL